MVASTTVRIKNDTGDAVTFIVNHDYHGSIKAGTDYPKKIEKGSTAEFVFENTNVKENGESSGAVVYRGKNEKKDKEVEWMYAWSNMDGANEANFKAYNEIASAHHYDNDTVWKDIRTNLMKSDNHPSAEWNECMSEAKISKPSDVVYDGKMYLEGGGNEAAQT